MATQAQEAQIKDGLLKLWPSFMTDYHIVAIAVLNGRRDQLTKQGVLPSKVAESMLGDAGLGAASKKKIQELLARVGVGSRFSSTTFTYTPDNARLKDSQATDIVEQVVRFIPGAQGVVNMVTGGGARTGGNYSAGPAPSADTGPGPDGGVVEEEKSGGSGLLLVGIAVAALFLMGKK